MNISFNNSRGAKCIKIAFDFQVTMQIYPLVQMLPRGKEKRYPKTQSISLKIGQYWWKSKMAASVYIVKN